MGKFDRRDEDQRSRPRLAGVASTIGDVFGVDPTLVRIGFAALALIVSWKMAIVAYVGSGLYLHFQEKKIRAGRVSGGRHRSEYDRMGDLLGEGRAAPRASIRSLREDLDPTDRRLMAIDHHLSTQNDELAREIDALREDK